jgi:hypothetical protein
MNIIKKIKASLRLREAIRKADKAFEETKERHYVMPTTKEEQLIIMDRKNFRILKQKHYISNKKSIYDLEKACFYCTPYANGNGKLSKEDIALKKQAYLKWIERK